MPNFKLHYIWILLIVFISGKMRSVTGTLGSTTIYKEQKREFKTGQKLTADTGDENSHEKRKIKKRGLPGVIPQIQNITFLSVFIYKAFKPIYLENVCTSFLYCVCLKRGPPLA